MVVMQLQRVQRLDKQSPTPALISTLTLASSQSCTSFSGVEETYPGRGHECLQKLDYKGSGVRTFRFFIFFRELELDELELDELELDATRVERPRLERTRRHSKLELELDASLELELDIDSRTRVTRTRKTLETN